MDKAAILARVRTLQRISDELAGMVATLEEPQAPPPAPVMKEDNAPEIMSARQVQAFLGIGESTFYTWVREGRLPPGEKWGARMKRWKRTEVLNWRTRNGAL